LFKLFILHKIQENEIASLSCRHKKFTKKTVTASTHYASWRRLHSDSTQSIRILFFTLRGGKSWNFLMNHRPVLTPDKECGIKGQ
ncbi:MAG: hypothetical protein Q8907_14480, partial [Bacteroidota bacterium]|nr:hypothetical protein [Bacteroidota bacterium]